MGTPLPTEHQTALLAMDERAARHRTDPEAPSLPLGLGPEQQRRKIRKGTRSCWACKRRKVRCSFPSAQNQTCAHCQRRGSQCVGQDEPEELVPTDDSLDERVRDRGGASTSTSTTTSNIPTGASNSTLRNIQGVLTPSSTDATLEDRDAGQPLAGLAPCGLLRPVILDRKDPREVSRALLSVYPPRRKLGALLEKLQQDRLYMILRNVRPSDVLLHEAPPAWDFLPSDLQHPSIDTHPVLIAHQMLLVVVMLQLVHKCGEPDSVPLDQLELMERLFDAAVGLVTTNESLQGTVESLECLIMESLYLANLGSLQESWRANRRAMLAAQQMGLHRASASSSRFKRLDPRTPVHRENLWFRLLYYDRNHCLMLGMPQGSADDSTPRDAARLDPLDRLDRAHASIATRVLERRDGRIMSEAQACALTCELDAELLLAAKAMPLKFWLPTVSAGEPHDSRDSFLELWRGTTQVFHFNLINQLHLPRLLRFDRDAQSERSKLACMAANREVLTRYLAYRTSVNLATSCLTFDFLSLMAAITLLLAHLHGHLRGAAGGVLEHQRLCDRTMMEQVLDTMKTIFRTSNDAMSQSSINMLRCLLLIEEDAADGGRYTAQCVRQPGSSPHDDDDDGDDHADGPWERTMVLRICIPYFGLVRISRVGPADASGDDSDDGTPTVHSLIASGIQDQQQQQHQTSPAVVDEQPAPQQLAMAAYAPAGWDELPLQQYWNPSMITGADDWYFQGIDLDFFGAR